MGILTVKYDLVDKLDVYKMYTNIFCSVEE